MTYLARIRSCVDRTLQQAPFHPSQRELLERTIQRLWQACADNPYGNALSPLCLIGRAWDRPFDEQSEHVATFCFLYIAALDLFDDVQDDDLVGKPHESAGPPVAINSALALLFLSLHSLERAVELEQDEACRLEFLRLFNRVSVLAVAGQHRDLIGRSGAASPEEVLAMHQAKTSSASLVVECGSLLARCGSEARFRYRQVGERLAVFVQVLDDLRDVFGKDSSPDLANQRWTYPIACFYEGAEPCHLEQFERLLPELPGSLPQVRRLLYETGVVERCVDLLDALRREIHLHILATRNPCPAHRLFLTVVDQIAALAYDPPAILATRELWQPRGGWHDQVRTELGRYVERMRPLGAPEPPRLEPWHLPYYLYDRKSQTIRYPDLEGFREEIVRFYGTLLGTEDAVVVLRRFKEQLPGAIAHEMFHFWRDSVGRLSEDSWHEEYVANRLAAGYLRRFCPGVLEQSLELATDVTGRFGHLLEAEAQDILDRCDQPSSRRGYQLDAFATGIVELELLRRIGKARHELEGDVRSWLLPQLPLIPARGIAA